MTTTILRSALLTSAAALILLTGAASGAPETSTRSGIPNARGIYSGCYQPVTGELRLIPGSKGCRSGESRVTWNRRGQRGPLGPEGPQGDSGSPGSQGSQGATGAQGATGSQGSQGPAGGPGAPGAQGPAGPQGAQGASGPQGPAGIDGATGPTGSQGDPGPTGATGATGPQGPPGPSDSQVLAAVSGTSGAGLNAGQSYSLTSTCPAGKKVLSGGWTFSVSTVAQTSRVSVDSYPSAADAWTVAVRVNQNLGGAVTIALSAYAVCTV